MSSREAIPPHLTRRERDVLAALCRPALDGGIFTEPASVREIATSLVVTEAAVKQHLLHLYDKFGIRDRGERRRLRLAREAVRLRAVAVPETEAGAASETRYVRSGDVSIAYQILGDGPVDLVFVPGFISNLEWGWKEPSLAGFYERLARFSRLIIFDKRGTGMSDRVNGVADLETRMDDVGAVMDAAQSARAVLLGYSEGASMAALFAATHPERTQALVMYGAFVGLRWSPETPWAWSRERFDRWVADIETRWGTAEFCNEELNLDAPSRADDEEFNRWYATRLRLGASPAAAAAAARMAAESDISAILLAIRVPTLVLHRSGDRLIDADGGRYLAGHIAGARYIELEGEDHLPWVGDSEGLARAVEDFVADVDREYAVEPDRAVTTVLFTDIVASTERAAALGDRRWRELLEAHHAVVRRELERWRGREVDTADGFLATFGGPARAIRCALAVREAVRALGIEIRVGLHTGECELVGENVEGIAVHTGARVAALAAPGEVLVSSTVKDLVGGSGIEFEERGEHELKGVPGSWRLYAVVAG